MIVPALIARTQTISEMTSPLNPLISRPVKDANARKRIIPAGAGNSPRTQSRSQPWTDHPRRRGELDSHDVFFLVSLGSSPQARGTRATGLTLGRARGIIPAGAGNSPGRGGVPVSDRDHPRRRGELWLGGGGGCAYVGSSPQARGTLELRVAAHIFKGIIPAGAGNSRRPRRVDSSGRDHPRRRGELRVGEAHGRRRIGSSPQARGTLTVPADG